MKKEKHIVKYSFYQKKVQDLKGAFVHDIRICGGDVWTSSLEFPSFSLSIKSGAKKSPDPLIRPNRDDLFVRIRDPVLKKKNM